MPARIQIFLLTLFFIELFNHSISQFTTNLKIIESKSVCLDSDIYDPETDMCLAKVNAVSKSCPKNCQKFGHLCKCIDEISIQSICPSEYVLFPNMKKCIKVEKLSPSIECGRGLKWSESKNICVGVKLSAPELTCTKENSMLINGVCLTYSKKSIQNVCEDGFTIREKSVSEKLQISQTIKLNTRGMKTGNQNNDELKASTSYCVREMSSPYTLECPTGFVLDRERSSCIAQIFSDPEPKCLPGFEFDNKSETCVNKSLEDSSSKICPKDYLLEGFQCVQSSFVSPEPRCREGFIFSVEDAACIKVLREPPSYRCPSDLYIFDGKQCELRKTEKPTIMCGNGTILDEKAQKCIKINVMPAKMVCSGGRQYDEDKKKCYVIQVQESTKVCSNEEKYDAQKDKCIKLEEKKPVKGCPYGFNLNELEQICVQENFEEPKLSCKAPFSLVGGDCLYNAEVKPEYVCPENFEYSEQNSQCLMQSTVQPENGCPEDYNEYIDKCIKQIEKNPVSVCPTNSKLNTITNECFISKKPLKECPAGFKPTNDSANQCIQVLNQNKLQSQVIENTYNGNSRHHAGHHPAFYGDYYSHPNIRNFGDVSNDQTKTIQLSNPNRRIGDSSLNAYPQNIKTAPKPRR
ncbi:oocyst wall protein 5 precursor [Cryptosporidium ubiquitum]|uniref:Oocyst wall protein 5 n=1 Tax=Cryptosporidium ubiquitum TaxID=857276 RepID=A0A1J4MNZ1_9CRYT|nr:oocyst wall protein 5 precursor [Cryptosporidium ubiquitum]OII75171.1 oocyst wall protein 5 precursor [Cryptosporidium ubiquitum]